MKHDAEFCGNRGCALKSAAIRPGAGVAIPLALRLIGGVSPAAVYRGAAPAIATVFATDSSSATMPVTLMCCKQRLRLPAHIVDFVIPLGTTINM